MIMAIAKKAGLIAVGGVALVALGGCEQLEPAATEAVDQAKQSAVQALDEARQAGSVEEAKQTADRFLLDAKEQASGLLDQASQYLSEEKPAQQAGAEQEQTSIATPEPTPES